MARRVLLIEDDDDVRGQLAQALRSEACDVVAFGGAVEATEHLGAGAPPDVIILDLVMPGMSGWELLDWLSKRGVLSQVPVLVISGSVYAERAKELHRSVLGSLVKPFDREALVAELDRIAPRR